MGRVELGEGSQPPEALAAVLGRGPTCQTPGPVSSEPSPLKSRHTAHQTSGRIPEGVGDVRLLQGPWGPGLPQATSGSALEEG